MTWNALMHSQSLSPLSGLMDAASQNPLLSDFSRNSSSKTIPLFINVQWLPSESFNSLLKIQIPPISILYPPQFGHFHSSLNSQEDHPAPHTDTYKHIMQPHQSLCRMNSPPTSCHFAPVPPLPRIPFHVFPPATALPGLNLSRSSEISKQLSQLARLKLNSASSALPECSFLP